VSSRPLTFRDRLAALRSAQKPPFGTAAYGRYVNRPAGRVVAALLHPVGVSPDGATAISALLSAAGIVLLAVGRPTYGPLVAVLLASGYVMDSVDGQLARLRGSGSIRGEWLDHTIDCFKTSTLHLTIAVAWYRHPALESRNWLLVPLGFSVVQSVTYFGLILVPFLRSASGVPKPTVQAENPWRRWLILPTDYGLLCWLFVLLPWQVPFLCAYSVVGLLSAAMLALALRKWWRELGAIDRSRGSEPSEAPQ